MLGTCTSTCWKTMTQRLAAIVSRFVTGSASPSSRQTNVDLSNKYIVLDLSELKGSAVGMFIALDYVWGGPNQADRTQRKSHLHRRDCPADRR